MFVIWNIAFYCRQMNRAFIDAMKEEMISSYSMSEKKKRTSHMKTRKKNDTNNAC